MSELCGHDRGPGARAQRHRGSTDGVPDRYLRPRQARLRLGHDRPPCDLDRTGHRHRQASTTVGPRSPQPLQRHVHGLRFEAQAARQLLHLQRHTDDRRHGGWAPDAQRPPARSARREPPRTGSGVRRGARRCPDAAADVLGAAGRGDPDPRPLPPEPGNGGDGRPGRDPALERDPRLGRGQPVPGSAHVGQVRPLRPAEQHPHQPEPPVDPAVERRQRAADTRDAPGGVVHRGRRRARAQAGPDPPGRHGDQRLAGRRAARLRTSRFR